MCLWGRTAAIASGFHSGFLETTKTKANSPGQKQPIPFDSMVASVTKMISFQVMKWNKKNPSKETLADKKNDLKRI